MEGWIKLHRKLLDHWIFKNEKYLKAWIWFLLRANHKENKILMGAEIMDIERGEFVTSIYKICEATGLTSQNVRTLIRLLENDQMINKRTTSKLTKITILNYDSYQIDQQTDNKQTNKPLTSAQQTANKPVTTDKNDKKVKECKEEILKSKQLDFKTEVEGFAERYNSDMLTAFYVYWSEPNQAKTKTRKEMQPTWDTARRLVTWYNRSKK